MSSVTKQPKRNNDEEYFDPVGCGFQLLTFYMHAILSSDFKGLKSYIELLRVKMEHLKPRNHLTLEMEYRHLRRKLHRAVAGTAFLDFRTSEDVKKPIRQHWVDPRSGVLYSYATSPSEDGRSKRVSSTSTIIGSSKNARELEGFLERHDQVQSYAIQQYPGVNGQEASKHHNNEHSARSINSVEFTGYRLQNSRSSNSKGQRVRFDPEVHNMHVPQNRKMSSASQRVRKPRQSMNISNISTDDRENGSYFFLSNKTISLLPLKGR